MPMVMNWVAYVYGNEWVAYVYGNEWVAFVYGNEFKLYSSNRLEKGFWETSNTAVSKRFLLSWGEERHDLCAAVGRRETDKGYRSVDRRGGPAVRCCSHCSNCSTAAGCHRLLQNKTFLQCHTETKHFYNNYVTSHFISCLHWFC